MRAASRRYCRGRSLALRYLVVGGAVGSALLIRLLLSGVLADHAPLSMFVMAVAVSAWYGGFLAGLCATLLGALVGYSFFLLPYQPALGLAPHDQVRLVIFLLEGLGISLLIQWLRQARRRAEATTEQLGRLQSVVDGALGHLALDDLLGTLLARIRAVLTADAAVVLLPDAASNALLVRAAVGLPEHVAQQLRIPVGVGFAGMGAAEHPPVLIQTAAQMDLISPALRKSGVQSLLGAPLVIGNQLIGVVYVGSLQPRIFSPADSGLLQLVAERVAQAIERARLLQETQAALQQREEALAVLNTLLDRAPIGFGLFDRQLRYQRINHLLASMNGLPPEYHLGTTMREVLPGLASKVEPLLQQVLATNQPLVNLELSGYPAEQPTELRSYLASYYPVRLPDGALVGVGAIVSDITARKRAELAQRHAAERLAALHAIDRAILQSQALDVLARSALNRLLPLVRADAALVIQHMACGGEVLAAVNLPAVQPGQRVPLTDMQVLAGGAVTLIDDLHLYSAADPLLMQLGVTGYRSLLRVPLRTDHTIIGHLDALTQRPGGFSEQDSLILVEVAAQLAVAIEQGRLRLALKRHASELELRVAERTAQLQTANADLEEFASIAAHDLRAPLRAVLGYAAIIEEDYGALLGTAGQQYLQRIGAAARQMDQLVQDLLHYSRISRAPLDMAPLPLHLALDEALAQLACDIASAHAEVQVTGPFPVVVAHGPTLVQALANMLSNALTFVAPGVVPQVRVWADPACAEHDNADARVRLWVADNGIGIAPEHQARIFLAFERLHSQERYAGTGIGLAIVRKGIERMGGQVGVVSAEGQGSQFWIELPCVKEQSA